MQLLAPTVFFLALVVGCGGVPLAPPAVRDTLSGIHALGLTCDAGEEDNVPSGLTQWPCRGAIDGVDSSVLVDGNDEGVNGISLVTGGPPDPDAARVTFSRLVTSVPPLDSAPALPTALDDWDGDRRVTIIGGVRVSAECGATLCSVAVSPPTDHLLEPLPLP